ncbi:MAG: LCP family protein [Lachnospiraceae bacterium]|nr:LCP family protein [Lachnospiraceae bacterium]
MGDKKKAVHKTNSPVRGKTNVRKKTKRQKLIRGLLIAICVVTVVCIVAVVGGFFLIQHYINKTNYVADNDVTTLAAEEISSILAEESESKVYYTQVEQTNEAGEVQTNEAGEIIYETVELDLSKLTPEQIESLESSAEAEYSSAEAAQAQLQNISIIGSSDVYNILLIGVDVRAGSNWNGNSDSMILLSINRAKGIIYMTSFMRDTYVAIPGVGSYKLNRAHAVGGGPLLCQTVEQNFRIKVDAYARVNFYNMIDIIDAIGGVDLTISADEARVANNYINEICNGVGLTPSDYYVSEGSQHMNGVQAVAYCRIRYVGSDYARTQRQRTVLTLMFQKLMTMDLGQINNFLNTALPLVTHNIPSDVLTSLVLNVPTYLTYGIEQMRVPFDGAFTSQNDDLVPNYEYTITRLQQTIYY